MTIGPKNKITDGRIIIYQILGRLMNCLKHQQVFTYVWVTLCTPEKGKIFPFPLPNFSTKQHPLNNFVSYPLCFLTAFCSDVTSQLFCRERGGASDSKNPDLHYCNIRLTLNLGPFKYQIQYLNSQCLKHVVQRRL